MAFTIEYLPLFRGIAFSVIVIVVSSWVTKVLNAKNASTREGKLLAPRVPYWVPFVGNRLAFWMGPLLYMKEKKNAYLEGLYTLTLGTQQTTVLYDKELLEKLSAIPETAKDSISARIELASRGFGRSYSLPLTLEPIFPTFEEELKTRLDNSMSKLIKNSLEALEKELPHLLSFLESPIDQQPWERMSGANVLKEGESAEIGLIALVQTYLTFFTTEMLLSGSLFEDAPEAVPLLLTVLSQLESLLFKPKMLAPHPQAALRRLESRLGTFLEAAGAMKDPATENENALDLAENPTPFLEVLGLDIVQSSSAEVQATLLSYMLGLSILPHTLVPWSILSILSVMKTPESKETVKGQISDAVTVKQDSGYGEILPPPTVHFQLEEMKDWQHLVADTAIRFTTGWDEYTLIQDVTLSSDVESETPYLLPKGSRVLAAHWLDGSDLLDPENEEDQDRPVEEEFKRFGILQHPALSPYFAAIYPAFIAGFLALYDVELDEVDFKNTQYKASPGVSLPVEDIRVKIRRKKF